MFRLLHALVLGVVGAAIVHIVVVLLVPRFSERDAWAAIGEESALYETIRIDATDGGAGLISSVDPLFGAAACRFDLARGVVRITGGGDVPFWSTAIHDRNGLNTFSFTDRTSTSGRLDFVVATPLQMVELRNDLPASFVEAVFVEASLEEGIAVIRAFAPDASWEPAVSDYLSSVTCTLHELG
jgi:uncharacterized membrane protein